MFQIIHATTHVAYLRDHDRVALQDIVDSLGSEFLVVPWEGS